MPFLYKTGIFLKEKNPGFFMQMLSIPAFFFVKSLFPRIYS